MTRATLGSAVVAAVMAALVSAGAPGIAVVVADPGSHSSHSSHSRDRDRDAHGSQHNGSADRRGESRQGRGADSRHDDRPGRPERDPRFGGPGHRFGGLGYPDSRNPYSRPSGSKPSDSRNALNDAPAALAPSARSATTVAQARGQSDEQATARVEQQEPVVTAPEPRPAADAGGGGGGSTGPAVTMSVPRVVFGNGRTPSTTAPRPEVPPLVIDPAVLPSADAPEPAAAPPSPTARLHAPTIVRRTMTPLLTPANPASSVSSLWGLAGLILAPLAGILLGYRQAHAKKAAAELKSSLTG